MEFDMVDRVLAYSVKIFTARASGGTDAIGFHSCMAGKQGRPKLEITNVKDFEMLELWDDRCIAVKRYRNNE